MKKLSLFLLAMLCCVSTGVWASELTVADGKNTNSTVPFWGGNLNSYQRSQIIYSALDLSAMSGSSIYQMTFYLSEDVATSWGDALFKISLAEVEATDFGSVDSEAAFNDAELTQVYSGNLSVAGNELVIEFKTPYAYGGGNLLINLQTITRGSGVRCYFYGTRTASDGPIHGVLGTDYFSSDITTVSSTGIARFIPKATFGYGTKSSCAKPSDLIAYNVTYNSAKVGWTTDPTASYTLEYKKSGASSWTVIENASNGTALSDLAEYTTYFVRLKKDCGEEGVSNYATTSFFTPCAPLSGELPYEYDFEDVLINDIPTCWEKIVNNNYPGVQQTSAYGTAYAGEKYLYLYGGSATTECIVILPSFATPYSDLALSFWYKNGSTEESYGQAQIGYMTDKRFASSFVSIQDLERVTEYTHVENVALGSIPANAYLAIRIGNSTNGVGKLYLDNVVISSATPTCSKPAGLAVTAIKHNGATVTWEKGSAESSVLEYKLNDAAEWTIVNPATSPYALTNLEANSSYDVRVKNSCDGIIEPSSYASTSFETPCKPFEADSENPFSENFDGLSYGQIPECWDNSEMSTRYAPQWGAVSGDKHSGSKSVCFDYDISFDGYNSFLKTISIHIGSTATLSFWYKNTGAGDFSVYYSIDGGDRVLLESGLSNQSEWTEYTKALPSACTKHDVVLSFKGTVSGSGYIYLDDILVTCAETCPRPTNLAAAVSGNTVEVTWTKGGDESEWQYICQPKDEAIDWSGAGVKTATATTVVLEDLAAVTDYTFYLRAKCSAEDFSAVASKDFKTECVSLTALSCGFEASEGFEKGTTLPECWNTLGEGWVKISDSIPHSGAQHIVFGGGADQYVILPRFEQAVNTMQISFAHRKSSFTAYLVLGTMSDPADIATFTQIGSVIISSNSTYTEVTETSLAGAPNANHYIAFRYYYNPSFGSSNGFIILDDIVAEPIPTCKVPTSLGIVGEPAANSAKLAWTPNSTEGQWNIQLSTDGVKWSDDIIAYSEIYTLTSLTASTHYYVRVQADCGGGDKSKWSDIYEFNTACGTVDAPWSENFESYDVPALPSAIFPLCWDNSESTNLSSDETAPWAVWSVYEYSSNKMIRMQNYYADEGISVINTPSIALPASPAQELSFSYSHSARDWYNDDVEVAFKVRIKAEGDAEFAVLGACEKNSTKDDQQGTEPDELKTATFDLSTFAGKTITLQFYAESNLGKGAIYVDNVKVDEKSGIVTAVATVDAEANAIKRMENGMLYIIHDGKVYNAQGVRVK